ncbi:DUF1735 and LamG domain-containing protein [Prevotella sp.]|uniref:DUF1735 and LamG domain-containing protein n=1 Tax=Prevotella sp. TaxID=59823 RepID=UPI003076CB72
MNKFFKYIPALAVAFAMTACQSNDEEDFANKAFIDASSMVNETIVKGTTADQEKTLCVTLARPAEADIDASIDVNASLFDTYVKAYYANGDKTELLPTDNYEVLNSKVTINKGSVKSDDAKFLFKDLGSLDREIVYVLPVSVRTSNIDLLNSGSNYYFVFRAGALINVVTDMNKNYLTVNWSSESRSQLSNMTQVTFEALLYPRVLEKLISTVMGIEGNFLMRIGDAGYKPKQIQIATGSGNFPAASDDKLLATGKWQHVALTVDCTTGQYYIYIDGKVQSEGIKRLGSVNLTSGDFYIGKSWDDNRWFEGDMSELRVWNVVRTQDEIKNNIYSVDPQSEGLIAYWKMDDNTTTGKVVDATGHGNDAIANTTLSFRNVSLPEAGTK